jgi:hypothetical protein
MSLSLSLSLSLPSTLFSLSFSVTSSTSSSSLVSFSLPSTECFVICHFPNRKWRENIAHSLSFSLSLSLSLSLSFPLSKEKKVNCWVGIYKSEKIRQCEEQTKMMVKRQKEEQIKLKKKVKMVNKGLKKTSLLRPGE